MFLDPDPRPPKHSTMSGLSSSQAPTRVPRDTRPADRRKVLNERTRSQINQRRSSRSPEKPTVRLVKPSPAPDSPATKFYDTTSSPANVPEYTVAASSSPTSGVTEKIGALEAGNSTSDWAYRVSDSTTPANDPQKVDRSSINVSQPATTLPVGPFRSKWHRRSTSSGYNSESSTLKGSEFAFSQRSRKSERLSQGTTVRGTPTPSELDFRGRAEEEGVSRLSVGNELQTLQETSPERPTIRAVTPSVASSPRSDNRPGTGGSGPSHLRYHSLPPASEVSSTSVSRSNSRRTLSAGSAAPFSETPSSPPVIRLPPAPLTVVRPQRSDESFNYSEISLPLVSSPNFISYSPDSVRPRSRSQPLRDVASFDSINSRLQSQQVEQQRAGQSLITSPSWSSEASNDTLPALHLPRRRSRHASAQLPFGSRRSSSYTSRTSMASGEWDASQYRRQGFQSQLSTIASVSDQQSRAASHHLSHFSLGSGVSTVDDGDQSQLSEAWPARRRRDVPVESLVSEPNSNRGFDSSSGDEPGDMTLGIFRDESAKPPPLFTGDSTLGSSTMLGAGVPPQQQDDPSPLLSPLPRDGEGDEMFDTLSALQTVSLRQKRSGVSLRQRSNSTPSPGHSRQQSMISYVESDRWSYGSSIFPTWAKHYYGGTAMLSSKVSLSASFLALDRPSFHSRHSSTWTERSRASQPGAGYSNIESDTSVNRAFIPRFFRPPGRMGFRTPGSGTSRNNSRTSRWVQSSQPPSNMDAESRPDSMVILPNPLASSPVYNATELLPATSPEWVSTDGELTPSPENHLQLPRQYDRQKQWNTMDFPRPMTKDEFAEFDYTEPHLVPSKRNTQSRLSMWRPPSFVESLDTLIHSRCNRQILLFGLGFLCPLLWMLGASLPLPKRPMSAEELGQSLTQAGGDEVQTAMVKHGAADTTRRWEEERTFLKARWWRVLNRVMSVVGLLVIAAVVSPVFPLPDLDRID